MKNTKQLFLLLTLLLALYAAPVRAQTQQPVVHAVMFWMAGCPHCEDVIQNVLPPLQEKYGEQFDLFLIEVKGTPDVDLLYRVAASYGIPKEGTGVPFLIIGDQVLVGSDQVQNQLPILVDDYLTQGGLDYPTNPLLVDLLPPVSTPTSELVAQPPAESTPQPESASALPSASASATETQPREVSTPQPVPTVEVSSVIPVQNNGFTLAAVVVIFMILVTLYSLGCLLIGKLYFHAAWMESSIPWLSLIGLGVAAYLTYVETQSVQAFCGPVGDCNAVQASSYARLWGILPVGLLGAFGYIAILAAWWVGRQKLGWLSTYAPVALFGMALFGTIFSVYLTYLEIFVIKAVCIWCVSSAIIIALLLLFSLNSTLNVFAFPAEDLE
jgi:hypothetical protein